MWKKTIGWAIDSLSLCPPLLVLDYTAITAAQYFDQWKKLYLTYGKVYVIWKEWSCTGILTSMP